MLQDATVLMDFRSNYPIWKDDVLKVEIFFEFKRKVNAHVDASSMHQSALLPGVVPEVEQQMIAIKTTGFEGQITSMQHHLHATDNGVQRVYSLI
ncbi:hypothetical protein MAM1_0208c08029 [Mucor ambiguus]|uniref:Uncharacterized protein n=1 Tax=Mucor ambiguus TaxID=91626 RepID=A0A0C9LWH1_9FUNG|nr:hypothetical protein MAM1_0208c08029 [Mucor ambiguus]